jgi:hypothetical protein
MPQPRPVQSGPVIAASAGPEAAPQSCQPRLSEIAAFAPLPDIVGPGECGATDVVQLQTIVMPDRSRVALKPPATLRCGMAQATANWVRNEVWPAAAELAAQLSFVAVSTSYDCRPRNGVAKAKLSEHGHANALDIGGIGVAGGEVLDLTDPKVPMDFRDRMRASACAYFTTVLGPGADANHEAHIHIDLIQRHHGYRLCQWDVREPGTMVVADVPLPLRRPHERLFARRKSRGYRF